MNNYQPQLAETCPQCSTAKIREYKVTAKKKDTPRTAHFLCHCGCHFTVAVETAGKRYEGSANE